jgi:hypothetical protein
LVHEVLGRGAQAVARGGRPQGPRSL